MVTAASVSTDDSTNLFDWAIDKTESILQGIEDEAIRNVVRKVCRTPALSTPGGLRRSANFAGRLAPLR